MTGYRVLSFAAGSGKLGFVLFDDGKLIDWRMSKSASLSPDAAQRYARDRFAELMPDVVVTEDISRASHKGELTKAVVTAIAEVAAAKQILAVAIPRPRQFQNKYVEAAVLAERFPELQPWVPLPRRLWDGEPREVVYFEALVLALAVIEGRVKDR